MSDGTFVNASVAFHTRTGCRRGGGGFRLRSGLLAPELQLMMLCAFFPPTATRPGVRVNELLLQNPRVRKEIQLKPPQALRSTGLVEPASLDRLLHSCKAVVVLSGKSPDTTFETDGLLPESTLLGRHIVAVVFQLLLPLSCNLLCSTTPTFIDYHHGSSGSAGPGCRTPVHGMRRILSPSRHHQLLASRQQRFPLVSSDLPVEGSDYRTTPEKDSRYASRTSPVFRCQCASASATLSGTRVRTKTTEGNLVRPAA